MILIISEKNSVAVEIGKAIGATRKEKVDPNTKGYDYLEGNGYLVSWCVGHLIRLCDPDEYDPKYKSWDIDLLPIIPSQFQTKIARETNARYKALKILMDRDDVTELICATDAGREGELIFRLVYNQARCKKPFKRLWISSVAPDSIRAGMDTLQDGHVYDDLYNAAVCRQRADWLLGINLTRLYTKVYDTKLRIGRVKTPTVSLIVQRDQEIRNFVKKPYYSLTADFGNFKAHTKINDKAAAEAAAAAGNAAGMGTVISITATDKKERPPHLYDLTMLQRDANKLLGYTAKQTLDIAQTLYEKKITTYPRTDSAFLTSDAAAGVSQMLPHIYGMFHDILPGGPDIWSDNIDSVINEAKVSDHHALIPDFNYIENLSADDITSLPTAEKNVFFLILFRLIAALSPSRQYRSTSAHFISAVKSNTPTPVSGSFEQPSVGTCPKCGKKVFDTPKAYSCSGGRGCGFIIWKTIAGKSISSTQAEKLISSGRTGLIKGFKAKSGNNFDAYLVLRDDKTIGFEFPKQKKK